MIKIWNGKVKPTYYVDLIYPKVKDEDIIRLVLRNQQGKIVEGVLELVIGKGVRLLDVESEDAREYLGTEFKKLQVLKEEIGSNETGFEEDANAEATFE